MRRAFIPVGQADSLAAWLRDHLNDDAPKPVREAVSALAKALANSSVQLIEINISDRSRAKPRIRNTPIEIGVIRQAGNNPYSRTRIGSAASEAEALALAGDVVIKRVFKMRIAGELVWLLET